MRSGVRFKIGHEVNNSLRLEDKSSARATCN